MFNASATQRAISHRRRSRTGDSNAVRPVGAAQPQGSNPAFAGSQSGAKPKALANPTPRATPLIRSARESANRAGSRELAPPLLARVIESAAPTFYRSFP